MVVVQAGKERATAALDLHVRPALRRCSRIGGADRHDPVALDPHVDPRPVDLGVAEQQGAHATSWPSTAAVSAPSAGAAAADFRGPAAGAAARPVTSSRGPATVAAMGAMAASMSQRPPARERLEHGSGGHQAGEGIGHGVGQEARPPGVVGDQASGGGRHVTEPHPLAQSRCRARGW